MQKTILLSAFFLFICYNGFSQKKNELSVSLGPSFPIGDYGSKDPNNSYAGVAKTGEQFTIDYTRSISKRLGITASLFGQRNGFDVAVIDNYNNSTTGATWDFNKTSWKMGGIFIGVRGQFPINKKLSLTLKAQPGYMSTAGLTLNGHATTDTSYTVFYSNLEAKWTFAMKFGAGAAYTLNKKYFIQADLEWLITPVVNYPAKETITQTHSSSIPFSSSNPSNVTSINAYNSTAKQAYESINIGLGIGMWF